MSRQILFKHYWWIALVGGSIGVATVVMYDPNDRIPLVGSIVAATLAFCYFVQQ
jgi:hypothetical protein